MTGREFSEVDIDLLADYVGGALDGTPDEAVVAALIAEDPDWRTAHESLTAGMLAVGADLRALGADPAPMPADVVARLSAALARPALELASTSAPESAPESAADRPRLTVLPRDKSSSAPRARRGLPRWAGPVAVAAGVLAFAGFGVDRFWGAAHRPEATNGAASTANLDAEADAPMLASAAPGAFAQGLAAAPPPERITSSGIDYSVAVLAANVRMGHDRSSPSEQGAPADPGGFRAESTTGPGLERLGDRQALLDCLRAVADEAGTGAIFVDTVDYARFAGAPALIVRFTAADGAWAWAAGPDCGTPGSGADTRYRVKVG